MIRKKEMEKIKEFCQKNNLIYIHEFNSVKDMEEDMSLHRVTFKRGGQEVITFEKRTMYDFEQDTIGVIWVVIDDDDATNYIDSLYSTLKYIEKVKLDVAKKN